MPSVGSYFPLCSITVEYLLVPNFMLMSLLEMTTVLSNVFNSFSVIAYSQRSFMYSKWLRLCPPYNVYFNVVLFNVVLRGFNVTQRARGDNVSPWNIQQFIEIFTKRVPHAVSHVFHWFMD